MFCPSVSVQPSLDETPTTSADTTTGPSSRPPCPCQKPNCHCLPFGSHNTAATASSALARKSHSQLPRPVDQQWHQQTIAVRRRRRAKHYNPLTVCVTIPRSCTDRQLAAVFAAGCRCIHLQLAYTGTGPQLDQLMMQLRTAMSAHALRTPNAMPIASVVELRGQVVRTGRMHNDRPQQLTKGGRVFVTSNREYENGSTADVIYISNFERYLRRLNVGEYIFIDR